MKSLRVLSLIGPFLFSSCATTYQPSGFSGGFSETRYAPDVVLIRFNGNGYTSSERAQDYALLRTAEHCLQSGYRYFHVGNDQVSTSTSSFTTAGSSYTTGSVYGVTPYGGNYSQTTTTIPGQTITVQRPQASVLAKYFHEKPKGIAVFDAEFIVTSLKEKYRLK